MGPVAPGHAFPTQRGTLVRGQLRDSSTPQVQFVCVIHVLLLATFRLESVPSHVV